MTAYIFDTTYKNDSVNALFTCTTRDMAGVALVAVILSAFTKPMHSVCIQPRFLGVVKVISKGQKQFLNNTIMTRCTQEALFRFLNRQTPMTYSFSEKLQQCILVEGQARTSVTQGGEDWRSYMFGAAKIASNYSEGKEGN